jgi:hypothetical protein
MAARALGAGPDADTRARVAARRGFEPLRPGDGEPAEFEPPPGWSGQLSRMDARNRAAPKARTLDPRWLEGQIARIRAAGSEVVYLVGPTVRDNAEVHALARDGRYPDLLAFDSPTRHPELFEPANRRDAYHLNEAGARAWSRALAEPLAARLRDAG